MIGLVPARGGSKGIPRKNIKPLGGKPLIQWTIEAARASKCLDRLLVSTEDHEIKAVAGRLGVEVLDRPAALARDETPMLDVVDHALTALTAPPDVLVLLQPTSPFRRPETIKHAVETLRESADINSVAAVTPIPARYSPHRAFELWNGRLLRLLESKPLLRRQEAGDAYILAGTVYAARVKALEQDEGVWPYPCAPLIVEGDEAVNLDEPEDWDEAERRLAGMLVTV